jgi:hypothetical protein
MFQNCTAAAKQDNALQQQTNQRFTGEFDLDYRIVCSVSAHRTLLRAPQR